MRGKQINNFFNIIVLRITPADAGKTSRRGSVHTLYKGSPPRMRGKPGASKGYERSDGITPADAGKTAVVVYLAAVMEDHPRGCGENTKKIL